MNEKYTYAVIEITDKNKIRIKKAKTRDRMLRAVKAAIKRKNHYTVIRRPISCTTV